MSILWANSSAFSKLPALTTFKASIVIEGEFLSSHSVEEKKKNQKKTSSRF